MFPGDFGFAPCFDQGGVKNRLPFDNRFDHILQINDVIPRDPLCGDLTERVPSYSPRGGLGKAAGWRFTGPQIHKVVLQLLYGFRIISFITLAI